MKTLNLYIGRQLLGSSLIAVGVLTFVMLSANLMRAFELVHRGVSLGIIFRFLLYLLPSMLTYTIPMSVLCASVLVFSRLSADNEVTAMRASGVGLWQIISPGLFLSIFLSAVCVILQVQVAPNCKYLADRLKKAEAVSDPLAFLEPGRFVEVPGHIIYIGNIEGRELTDIHILGIDANGKVAEDITARTGQIHLAKAGTTMELALQDATIVTVDPAADEGATPSLQRLSSRDCVLPIDYQDKSKQRKLFRRTKHMDIGAIFGCIRLFSEHGGRDKTTPLYVELHTRLSLAMSPFAFLLLGVPFGIRTKRTETSIGVVMSIILALVFYVFVVLADNLRNESAYHPELLVWLPNIIYQLGGLCALAYTVKR